MFYFNCCWFELAMRGRAIMQCAACLFLSLILCGEHLTKHSKELLRTAAVPQVQMNE
jgi:hypothetical protein